MTNKKESILSEAQTITDGARRQDYGSVKDSFMKIGTIASILCNKEISALDACRVLKAVKLVRESHGHKRDHLVDEVGYARLESILLGEE